MRLQLLFTALLIIGRVGLSQAGAADSLRQLLDNSPNASAEQRAAWASRLGHEYANRYQYDSALALYAQALEGYRQAGNQHMAFDVLFDLGYTHYAMYEYSRALEIYHQSLELAESLDDDSLRAISYDWISLQYLYSGAYGQAITNQLASIRIREARKDSAGLAESFYSMGDILSHQHKLEESNAYFRRCIQLASRFNQKSLLLGAYGTIGAAFIEQNQWDSAFWYNRVALRIAQRNEMDYGIAFANGALG
ncbi:MAG: tetratricopeptide repeat protein, partial [Bacteroidetes bacterium]|nr:tetratricopeptide repeat protein [Bacteroidota bacterium]